MAPNSPSSSPDDRRNISSLLNPSDNMESVNSGPPNAQTELGQYPQQSQHIAQGQRHSPLPIINHTGVTHQSHLFPPLPPDHPMQAILVQSATESNNFRLSRASWGGDGPPPESLDNSSQKRKLSDSTEERISPSERLYTP
ncbi:hypothetical protein K439DRAFT_125042 [Ramaria rubella]|nr:hypothetical protein K439DRAFT_425083 [Ramaria rubella]KAF8582706.1 hypothetical protein K439DRAFT_125042 [Ramaria rubella]